jgi:hypothetical protein
MAVPVIVSTACRGVRMAAVVALAAAVIVSVTMAVFVCVLMSVLVSMAVTVLMLVIVLSARRLDVNHHVGLLDPSQLEVTAVKQLLQSLMGGRNNRSLQMVDSAMVKNLWEVNTLSSACCTRASVQVFWASSTLPW